MLSREDLDIFSDIFSIAEKIFKFRSCESPSLVLIPPLDTVSRMNDGNFHKGPRDSCEYYLPWRLSGGNE